MNGTMPSRDSSHRKGNSCRQTRVVLGVEGLVDGIANHSRRRMPPGCSPAARRGRGGRKSGFDRVGPLPVLSLGGRHRHPHLLPDGAREESAHGMGCQPVDFISSFMPAPSGRFSRSSTFAVLLPSRAKPAFPRPVGAFLEALALGADFARLGATCARFRATRAFLLGFAFSAPVTWAVRSSVVDVVM